MKFLWLREGADYDGVLGPARWGVGGFGGGGDGFVDAFHGHASGEDLEGSLGFGLGGVLGELLVEFGRFRAGDDLDDIGAVGRADLDFESAFVRAGDVDGFVGGDECVAAPAVREEDDGGAIALVAKDGDVCFLSAANAEGDVFASGVGAFAIDGEDFYRKIFGHTRDAAFGEFLDGGAALLDILRFDGVFDRLLGGLDGIGPDFCPDFGYRDGYLGFLDLTAFQPSELGHDGNFVVGGVEAAANKALHAFDRDFLDTSSGL